MEHRKILISIDIMVYTPNQFLIHQYHRSANARTNEYEGVLIICWHNIQNVLILHTLRTTVIKTLNKHFFNLGSAI